MNISGFTDEALNAVSTMLYAEGQVNPLEGECGQKAKRKAMAKPRTPLQEQADRARSVQQQGRAQGSSATRSEAAKKAAETRKRCKGGGSSTGPSTPA
jgi:hypothetical protein